MKTIYKVLLLLPLVFLVLFIFWMIVISISSNGLGLYSYSDPNGDYHLGKSLWDWLELLFVPISLAVIAYFFTRSEKRREAEFELDRIRESSLQNYYDHIEKMIGEGLKTSTKDDVKRELARIRTITTLRILDGKRKALILEFLYQAGLLNKSQSEDDHHPIIVLRGADLRGTDLSNVLSLSTTTKRQYGPRFQIRMDSIDLAGVDFTNSDLTDVFFNSANLAGVNFSYSKLINVSFYEADLQNADMNHCDLTGSFFNNTSCPDVNFSDSNLKKAECSFSHFLPFDNGPFDTTIRPFNTKSNFSRANLSDARFDGSYILPEQLKSAKSLKRTILPNSTDYDSRFALYRIETMLNTTEFPENPSRANWDIKAYCICGKELQQIYTDDPVLGFWYGLVKHRIKDHHHKIKSWGVVGGMDYQLMPEDVIIE